MIEIKSDDEIKEIEIVGGIVKYILERLQKRANIGGTTIELDRTAEKLIRDCGCRSAFKGYKGFPANICTSINEGVVHGIPCNVRLKEGDILSIDVAVEKKGFFADSAITILIGTIISKNAINLVRITESALKIGIDKAREGNRVFDISYAIQNFVENKGYSVVRDFVGHGIGKAMHEAPEVPNFGKPGTGPRLKKGMVLAIEPMVNEGVYEVEILEDGWTSVTKDRKLSAHFEHTVCITDKEAKILT